jgi:hypothetical protein
MISKWRRSLKRSIGLDTSHRVLYIIAACQNKEMGGFYTNIIRICQRRKSIGAAGPIMEMFAQPQRINGGVAE